MGAEYLPVLVNEEVVCHDDSDTEANLPIHLSDDLGDEALARTCRQLDKLRAVVSHHDLEGHEVLEWDGGKAAASTLKRLAHLLHQGKLSAQPCFLSLIDKDLFIVENF